MPNTGDRDCNNRGGKHYSKAYDFRSIMSYPSSLGVRGVPRYPLLRHKRDLSHGEPTDIDNLIYMGGRQDPRLAGPSRVDIEGVATLYPKKSESVDAWSLNRRSQNSPYKQAGAVR